MKRVLIGLSLAALAAGAALAQPYDGRDRDRDRDRGREPVATLYEGSNFEAASTTIRGSSENLNRQGFNDRARSGRFVGSWRVCEHANYGGRCEVLQGDVPDLSRYGLGARASSLELVRGGRGDDEDDRPGGGWERDERRHVGTNSVFFPRPQIRGQDVAAGGTAANTYCRRNGLGAAVYYDSSRRAPRAVDGDGRQIGASPVLSDLLCRRY